MASTLFWVDPREDLQVIFMTQLVPSRTYNLRGQFKNIVYSALSRLRNHDRPRQAPERRRIPGHHARRQRREMCFANPGTSEMHFVAALDRIAGVRCVLGLFEGVVTGAADGYYRMAGKPAATLLHLGPGLGNGLANLHNAGKARSGIVNVVGDHALDHARFESPLKSDAAGHRRQRVGLGAQQPPVAADVGPTAPPRCRPRATVPWAASPRCCCRPTPPGGRAAAPRWRRRGRRPTVRRRSGAGHARGCSAWGRARCCCWAPAAAPASGRSTWPPPSPPRPVAG
jgi:hypothetical protein